MGKERIELSQYCYYWILSPTRLPVPPFAPVYLNSYIYIQNQKQPQGAKRGQEPKRRERRGRAEAPPAGGRPDTPKPPIPMHIHTPMQTHAYLCPYIHMAYSHLLPCTKPLIRQPAYIWGGPEGPSRARPMRAQGGPLGPGPRPLKGPGPRPFRARAL